VAVIWTERSRDGLIDIFRFIARDNWKAAERWVGRLIERAELAASMPLGGRVVPEPGRDDIREVFERSYRILYRIAGKDIHVLTVFDGHRRVRPNDIEEE
jgi:toxin ParE1/3/4